VIEMFLFGKRRKREKIDKTAKNTLKFSFCNYKTLHIINKIMGDIKKEPGKGILFFLNVDTFISAEKELT
jgi:hypothetical protein